MRSKLSRLLMNKHRTPGERAFDQAFLPIAALTVLGTLATSPVSGHLFYSGSKVLVPPHWWDTLLAPFIGIVLAAYWIRAFRSLIRGWDDPAAKVLRFSTVICLLFLAAIVVQFLTSPL